MNCQQCGSENTQRFQMAYEHGTQNINTSSRTLGLGFAGGGLGVGSAATATSGTSQSLMAQKVAPPLKKALKKPIIAILVGLLLMSAGHGAIALGLFVAGPGAFFVYKALSYNSSILPVLQQRWLSSWLCHKCGNTFSA
jgi:hypothetical protein